MFSYNCYRSILRKYVDKATTYDVVLKIKPSEFALIRHDVEFSVGRALAMARIDSEIGVKSTFFFQVRNNAYNLMSIENEKAISQIVKLGMDIGLHFYVTHIPLGQTEFLEQELIFQAHCISQMAGIECKSFSYHRPPAWVLQDRRDLVCGLINAYGCSFFECSSNPVNIKYIADSQHKFKYGHPLSQDVLKRFNKYQLLLHPDEWGVSDSGVVDNFKLLIAENKGLFCQTLASECNHYIPEVSSHDAAN